MRRRRFLKLLGALFLALGLRPPIAEPEPEPEVIYSPNCIVYTSMGTGDPVKMCLDGFSIDSYSRNTGTTLWVYDQDDGVWKSDDMGKSWQNIVCQDLD